MEIKHEKLWPIVRARLREYMTLSNWNIAAIAEATDSTCETVTGWLGTNEPTGERLIKLWHVLEAAGLDSPELQLLTYPNRLCGQLLTFGCLSLKELQGVIGVQNHQAVLRMLRGSTPARWMNTPDELTERYWSQLEKARQRIPKVAAAASGTQASERPVVPVASVTPVKSLAGDALADLSGDPTLLTAVLLSAASPLVRHLESDACTPQERSRLRDLMGDSGMFNLSTSLNRLCSERARNLRK